MQAVPQSVLDAFSANGRSIRARVEVYFGVTPTIYNYDDFVQGIDLISQEGAMDNSPYGIISANHCTVSLNNLDRRFTVNNTASPLYGQLTKGIKVVIKFVIDHLVAEVPTPYTLTVGTFYTTEWRLNDRSLSVDMVCIDKLGSKKREEISNSKVYKNITVNDALVLLFTSVGLSASDYDIESGLNYVMPYYYITQGTLGSELQKFVAGYGCRIYTGDNDKILVRRARTGASVITLTGTDQVISVGALPDSLKAYSQVQVNYRVPELLSGDTLYNGEIGIGSQQLIFRSTGVLLVESLDSGTTITSLTHGNSEAVIASAASNTLKILGTRVAWKDTTYKGQDAGLVAQIGEVVVNINSTIVQDSSEASNFASFTLSQVINPKEPFVSVNCRGSLALQLGDRISVVDAHGLFTGDYYIVEMRYKYNGGLNATYKCIYAGVS